jgi:hypothetical protein
MHKIRHEIDGQYREHSFPAHFKLAMAGTVRRVHAGLPAGSLDPFKALMSQLEPPLLLLYVLHMPRGEAEPGRYESEETSQAEVIRLVDRFAGFLCSDSRFDLWVYSPSERATIVLDRHHQLFAYGPLDRFSSALRALGYEEGEVAVPFPHMHQYMPEFDSDAKAFLGALAWSRSDLQPEDED